MARPTNRWGKFVRRTLNNTDELETATSLDAVCVLLVVKVVATAVIVVTATVLVVFGGATPLCSCHRLVRAMVVPSPNCPSSLLPATSRAPSLLKNNVC